MYAKILWIERGNKSDHLLAGLRKRKYQVTTARSGREALDLFPSMRPDLLVLHAASLRTSGNRLSRRLREKHTPILLIARELPSPTRENADEILVLPFTLRKLANRIDKMVGAGDRRIKKGPLVLDLEYQYLQCNGNRADLTPLNMRLLQVLMEHPGEVLERDYLFRTVWETSYTGDTRSLDVHISWLRRALGAEYQDLLKTVRGVGYRLDV
jgi:DNA-binding response OmpR family regulator